MIKVTHLGEDYAIVEINGEEFETSLGFGEALFELIGQCKHCGEPMHTLVKSHHHTELVDGVITDVTK